MLVVCAIFAFAACTPKVQDKVSAEPSASASASEEANADTNSDLAKIASESERILKESEQGKALLQTMDISITAEGNVMVYKYTLKDLASTDPGMDTMKSSLEEALKAQESTLQSQLKIVQASSGIKDASFRIEYYGNDGELLFQTDITNP